MAKGVTPADMVVVDGIRYRPEDVPDNVEVDKAKLAVTHTQRSGSSPAEDEGDGYDKLTNDQLRDELADRELETGGNKAELIARLREDDAAADADES